MGRSRNHYQVFPLKKKKCQLLIKYLSIPLWSFLLKHLVWIFVFVFNLRNNLLFTFREDMKAGPFLSSVNAAVHKTNTVCIPLFCLFFKYQNRHGSYRNVHRSFHELEDEIFRGESNPWDSVITKPSLRRAVGEFRFQSACPLF